MSEPSYEDVYAELTAAAQADAAEEQAAPAPSAPPASPAPESGAPEESAPPVEGQAPEAPVAPEAPEPVVPFNPDELPEELIPAWKQLQSAFTPRLQEAAAIKKQFEELGGQETIQQAVELYTRIADPQSWPELYEELYRAMESAGFEFEDPSAPTQAGITPLAPGELPVDDPEFAPIIAQLEQLNRKTAEQQTLIDNFYAQQRIQQEMAEEELRQTQYLADMSRQVTAVRQANPHYTDDDMRAIIELGSFYNDDLSLAQQRFEEIVASRLDRYVAQKRAGAPASVQPQPGAGVTSHVDADPDTMEDAEARAIELVRRMQAAGEFEDY